MITGNNVSKVASNVEPVDYRKFVGVASVSILSVNPNNARLRSYGWQVPEGSEEPKYMVVDSEGRKSFRLRLLVQIQDLPDKPVVPMDFWLRPDVVFNKDQTKCKVIDSFGRTAYGTKAEVQAHQIPQYTNGPASINSDYKPCHNGEEEIVSFLIKYLNITPLQIFDRNRQSWVPTKNPGHITIDNWKTLCDGNTSEITAAIALQPDNRVKVCFGVRTTEDNKSYQTFLTSAFFSNGLIPDRQTGEYASVRKAIDRWREGHPNSTIEFSSAPVREWNVSATEVKENAVEDMPDFGSQNEPANDLDSVFGPAF